MTERLLLRRMRAEDTGALLAVLGDAEAMRFYPAPFTRDRVQGWIEWNLRNYEEHGYGLWSIVLSDSGEVVGDCGLTWQRVGYAPAPELEMGWHVRRDLWNRGYATEAALGVRSHAQDVLGAGRLVALIAGDNLSSQAVARKVGMTFERWDRFEGKDRMVFATREGPRDEVPISVPGAPPTSR